MKAATYPSYGLPDVISVKEVATPIPEANQILVKVHASSVTTADTMLRRGDPFFARFATGFPRPKVQIIGTGYAGEIVGKGEAVSAFSVGDKVFGETAMGFSANAEYVCVDEKGLIAKLPDKMTYAEAAPLGDGALTAYNFLRSVSDLQAGHRILVNGASGSIGTAAIQIAKYFGAHVTAVCSEKNHPLVKSLGADEVVDYSKDDFAHHTASYDIIFDTVGKRRYGDCMQALKEGGEFISPVLTLPLLGQMLWTGCFGSKKAKFSATGLKSPKELQVFLTDIIHMIETGKLKTVIDRQYPLEQIIDAHKYVETGHKSGCVVVTS